MENVPTAEKFLSKKYGKYDKNDKNGNINGNFFTALEKEMIEFAKLHAKKQLEAILKNVKMKVNPELNGIKKNLAEFKGEYNNEYQIDVESITNAYDLNNIK